MYKIFQIVYFDILTTKICPIIHVYLPVPFKAYYGLKQLDIFPLTVSNKPIICMVILEQKN